MRPLPLAALAALALLAGCGGNDDVTDQTDTDLQADAPAISEAPLPSRPLAPGSKTLRDPDIPFKVRYPPYLRRGLEAPEGVLGIASSLVVDRHNAVLFSDFGAGLPSDALGAAIAGKLPEGGPELTTHQGEPILFSLNVRPEDFPDGQIAGQEVSARRYFFSLGGSSWEVSCQYTEEFREAMIAACDQLALSIEAK